VKKVLGKFRHSMTVIKVGLTEVGRELCKIQLIEKLFEHGDESSV
jgi:hypothetical protein